MNSEIFKQVFPYVVQMLIGIGAALMVLKVRLIKIESRLSHQEKATAKLEKDTETEFGALNKKLDGLLETLGELKEGVSSINGYLKGRREKADEIAFKRQSRKV